MMWGGVLEKWFGELGSKSERAVTGGREGVRVDGWGRWEVSFGYYEERGEGVRVRGGDGVRRFGGRGTWGERCDRHRIQRKVCGRVRWGGCEGVRVSGGRLEM